MSRKERQLQMMEDIRQMWIERQTFDPQTINKICTEWQDTIEKGLCSRCPNCHSTNLKVEIKKEQNPFDNSTSISFSMMTCQDCQETEKIYNAEQRERWTGICDDSI